MDNIGLKSNLGSTVQQSSVAGHGGRAGLDWKIKAAIVMLIVAFLYATVSRVLKKKSEGKKAVAAAPAPAEEKQESKK